MILEETIVEHEGKRYLVRCKACGEGTAFEVFEASDWLATQHEVVTMHEGQWWGLVTTRRDEVQAPRKGLRALLVSLVFPDAKPRDLGSVFLVF